MTSVIASREITVHPSSYIDRTGRVFEWDGRIFRGITQNHVRHFQALMTNGILKRLEEQKMIVESWIPRERFEAFDFVIEHRRVPFVNYCMEWTPSMLRDAALLTLRIARDLVDEGYTLQDAFPWNIIFEGRAPRFVDIGSFVPTRSDMLWVAYDQFCNFFLFPLYLYSVGRYEEVRPMLFDYLHGVSFERWSTLLPFVEKIFHPLRYAKFALPNTLARFLSRFHLEDRMRQLSQRVYRGGNIQRVREKFFHTLLEEVTAITFPKVHSHWSLYYAERHESYTSHSLVQKQDIFSKIITQIHPDSLLDVGTNTGTFAHLAAAHIARVTAVDADGQSVEQLYSSTRNNVLPLVLDVLNPTPAFGWRCIQFPSAIERLRADTVSALALIHHLAIGSRQGFGRAIDALGSFSQSSLIVEWIGPDDPKVKVLMKQTMHPTDWYTFENFEKELRERYKLVQVFPAHAPERQFILCRK